MTRCTGWRRTRCRPQVGRRSIAVLRKIPVIGRVAAVAISAVSDAYHAGVTFATRTVLPVLRTAAVLGAFAVHVVATAYHQGSAAVALVKRVASATVKTVASFVKKHAATIASIAAGVVVFAGCSVLSGGTLAIGCAALAGVVASAITQGAKCYDGQKAACTAGSFVQAAVIGGTTGAITEGIGQGIGAAASGLIGAAGSSLARTAIGDTVTSTEDATAGATANSASWLSRLFSRAAKSCTVGGKSFTASTEVLTASGALVAISKLKIGEKVLATNTKTGKTTAGTISTVLVHHDTNRYDLTVKTAHGTAVIDTTSNHLFWDATARRWVKAAALKYGTHLRTPSSGTATALGGYAPKDRSGWMWDLTIPGNHDFYIQAATTAILVHNDTPCEAASRDALGRFTSGAGGDSAEAAAGRSAHLNYENTLGGGDYVFNRAMPGSSLRPDAVSFSQNIVRELKPDNLKAIAGGWTQVNGYKAYLEELTGEAWTAFVDVYK
jgi:large repetitive protein